MRYRHETAEAWLRWFMDPATADEAELRRALASIPRERSVWTFVDARLYVALEEEKGRRSGTAAAVAPGQERDASVPTHLDPDGRRLELLTRKEALYQEEANQRRPSGTRDSFTSR